MGMMETGLDTRPLTLEPFWALTVRAPAAEIDALFDVIHALAPLVHGATDANAWRSHGCTEYYRPREGTPTGAEDAVRRRPGVDALEVFLPRDPALLDRIVDALYEAHSYYEPVITVREVLRSHTKGLDDSANPNRWWNRGGDWKETGA